MATLGTASLGTYSQTTSRVAQNVYGYPFFVNDNTGRNITQNYVGFTNSYGNTNQILIPTKQHEYYLYSAAMNGSATFSISTASYYTANELISTPYICDEITVMGFGGSTTYSVGFSTGFNLTAGTISTTISANTPWKFSGVFNGNNYIGSITLG